MCLAIIYRTKYSNNLPLYETILYLKLKVIMSSALKLASKQTDFCIECHSDRSLSAANDD